MFKRALIVVLTLIIMSSFVFNNSVYADNLNLKSKSAILIDANTGQILYEKDSHKILPPASVTKVMTLLLAIEAIDSGKIKITDKVVTSKHAYDMGGTQIYLEIGEEMTVDDLMKAIAMNSANDASVALAEYIAGTEENFVEMMNKRAKELGAKNTNFKNASGLPEEGHVTTVYDMAMISRELVKHQSIFKYLTNKLDSLRGGKFSLINTNKLLWRYKGADGIKTGSTSEALYCLTATAKRGDTRLIAVVFGAPDSETRFNETAKLLDYGFANYETLKVASKGQVFGNVRVLKGKQDTIAAISQQEEYVLIRKGESKNIKTEINLNKFIQAPVNKDKKIGTVKVLQDGKVIKTFDLYPQQEVLRSNLLENCKKIFKEWLKK
ncbi:D-alanyl-D-alanine carboxypeptidase DacF [Thermoanaerobacter kivui]|uniref:serine-type D-Ala-D-Ala carboxypeptidase n=1 Tax=Thermoanaerobacter kivui TaxID=2325 RepID=A0A097ARE9_THEKI|nr:D-alanyl-D-alanine carboxypeptidase family protein [Thermoanaerobacter kivui]AIS52406.1 D-alanyl-D-alanine carboxypeptidase DacF [Thermoanaerobacter kivui]